MATYTKFNAFTQAIGRGQHNLNSDVCKVALSNTAPTAASNAALADITQISAGNGYTSGGTTIGSTGYSQTSGTGSFVGSDVVFTASGAVGPLRYAVAYDDTPTTPTADPLIAYWDYGSSISLASGETLTVDFGASIFTLA